MTVRVTTAEPSGGQATERRGRPWGSNINCDMGEAYSIYTCGDDEADHALHHLGQRRLRLSCLGPGRHACDRRARQGARREGGGSSVVPRSGRLRPALHEDGPQGAARRHHLSVRRAEGLSRDGGDGPQPPETARRALRRRLDRRRRGNRLRRGGTGLRRAHVRHDGHHARDDLAEVHGCRVGNLRRPRL